MSYGQAVAFVLFFLGKNITPQLQISRLEQACNFLAPSRIFYVRRDHWSQVHEDDTKGHDPYRTLILQ